jgi:hypothetical protein
MAFDADLGNDLAELKDLILNSDSLNHIYTAFRRFLFNLYIKKTEKIYDIDSEYEFFWEKPGFL